MMSFRNPHKLGAHVPMHIVHLLNQIDEYKGRQQLYIQQSPQMLAALRQVAMVQSTESSNRIEGIEIPSDKLRELMADKIAPTNRSEGEVAGYRDVLATIHAQYEHIPVTPNTVLQLHRDLFKFVPSEGGKWKQFDNEISDVLPDGTRFTRFKPVTATFTPEAMEELCNGFKNRVNAGDVVSLLAMASFVLDFLCIHPFRDGNGRMARLLTLLLLYQMGYEVGRYISLERLIEEAKESYYDSLAASSTGWHEGEHALLPWWEYILGIILAAYREFENRVGLVDAGRGSKSELVRQMIDRTIGEFTVADIMERCPAVSKDLVRDILYQMKQEGELERMSMGRYARWRKKV